MLVVCGGQGLKKPACEKISFDEIDVLFSFLMVAHSLLWMWTVAKLYRIVCEALQQWRNDLINPLQLVICFWFSASAADQLDSWISLRLLPSLISNLLDMGFGVVVATSRLQRFFFLLLGLLFFREAVFSIQFTLACDVKSVPECQINGVIVESSTSMARPRRVRSS